MKMGMKNVVFKAVVVALLLGTLLSLGTNAEFVEHGEIRDGQAESTKHS